MFVLATSMRHSEDEEPTAINAVGCNYGRNTEPRAAGVPGRHTGTGSKPACECPAPPGGRVGVYAPEDRAGPTRHGVYGGRQEGGACMAPDAVAELPLASRAAAAMSLKEYLDQQHSVRGRATLVLALSCLVLALALAFHYYRRYRRWKRDEDELSSPLAKSRLVSRVRAWISIGPHRLLMFVRELPSRVMRSPRGHESDESGTQLSSLATHVSVTPLAMRPVPTHWREPSFGGAYDGVPKLLASTSQPPTMLPTNAIRHLRRLLPVRYRPCNWELLYSTEQHGCSLRTFYRRIEQRGGTVLVIRDALGHVFGAFVAEDWHPSTSAHTTPTYFGNGETFLFKCNGDILERLDTSQ